MARARDINPTDEVGQRVGRALRELRRDARYTQTEVAVAIGMSQRQVSTWELGSSTPTLEQLFALERFLRLPPGAILVKALLVRVEADVEQAVTADSALSSGEKQALMLIIESFRRGKPKLVK